MPLFMRVTAVPALVVYAALFSSSIVLAGGSATITCGKPGQDGTFRYARRITFAAMDDAITGSIRLYDTADIPVLSQWGTIASFVLPTAAAVRTSRKRKRAAGTE